MIETLDVIDRLPLELQALLEANPFFRDIPVIVMEEGNVEAMLRERQAVMEEKNGKVGVAVIVLQLMADDDYPEQALGPLTLKPAFQVVENLELNRGESGTGKSARKVARQVQRVVKSTGLIGIVTDLVADKPCIRPVPLSKELGDLVKSYSVHFTAFEADDEEVSQVATPEFAPFDAATPKFQITCASEGAQIWWSADDSFPAPGRPGSQLYTEPIAIPDAGLTVRAAAYLEGSLGSRVNRKTITVEFG